MAGLALAVAAPLAASAHVHVDPESRIRRRHRDPHVLVLARLRRLADDRAWRSTSPTVSATRTPVVQGGWTITREAGADGVPTRVVYTAGTPVEDRSQGDRLDGRAVRPSPTAGTTIAVPGHADVRHGRDGVDADRRGRPRPARPRRPGARSSRSAPSPTRPPAPADDTTAHAADEAEALDAEASGAADHGLGRERCRSGRALARRRRTGRRHRRPRGRARARSGTPRLTARRRDGCHAFARGRSHSVACREIAGGDMPPALVDSRHVALGRG